jgi:uncharacterized membrane protein
VLAADNAWGIAAALWIVSGLGRVLFGGKETGFYWRNGFSWTKLALFAPARPAFNLFVVRGDANRAPARTR